MQEDSPHRAVESRAAPRTNLFLAATLYSADVGHPVKIRDLSATGARIETSLFTEVGDSVTLVRGPVSVHARVSWRAERFCGLSFSSAVPIDEWMINPIVVERRRRFPRIAVEGDVPVATIAHPDAGKAGGVAQDLSRVSGLLASLEEALANDPGFVFRHGTQLQKLRLAARTLAALAEIVRPGAPQAAAVNGRRDERGR